MTLFETINFLYKYYKVRVVLGSYLHNLRGKLQARFSSKKKSIKSLLKAFMDKAKGKFLLWNHPQVKLISLQAFYYKVLSTLLMDKDKDRARKKTLALIEKYEAFFENKYNESMLDYDFGQGIILEKAKIVSENSVEKGISVLRGVAKKRSYWGIYANQLLNKWLKKSPHSLNSENVSIAALGLWSQNKYQKAIPLLQKVVDYNSRSEEKRRNYAVDALDKIAQCYWYLEKYRKAGQYYWRCSQMAQNIKKRIEQRTKGGKKVKIKAEKFACEAAYWSYRSYLKSFKVSRDPKDQDRFKEIREILAQKWPDSEYAKNLNYYGARDLHKEASSLSANFPQKTSFKHYKRVIQAYQEAIKAYNQVRTDSDFYEKAFVFQSKCHFQIARISLRASRSLKKELSEKKIKAYYEIACKQFEKYIAYTENSKNRIRRSDVKARNQRRESLAHTHFYLARIYLYKKDSQKIRHHWNILQQKFPEEDYTIAVGYLLVKYLIQKKLLISSDSFNATRVLAKIEDLSRGKSNPTVRNYLVSSYYYVGNSYLKRKVGDSFRNYQQAVFYLKKWWKLNKKPAPSNYVWLAEKCIKLADKFVERKEEEKGLDLYKYCQNLYQEGLKYEKKESSRIYLQLQLAQCMIKTKDWLGSLKLIYPVFQEDRAIRKKKREKDRSIATEDPVCMDFLAETLVGLYQKKKIKNLKRLHFFLLKHSHIDYRESLKEIFFDANPRNVFEKYLYLKEDIAYIYGENFKKKEEEKQFIEKRKRVAQETNNDRRKMRNILKDTYQKKYKILLAQEFPLEPNETKSHITQIKDSRREKLFRRLCWMIADRLTIKLVALLPRYINNPDRTVGNYNNPLWWKAKYRQIYLLYLKGDYKDALGMIKILQSQQEEMGGEKYRRKFRNLQKLMRKTP